MTHRACVAAFGTAVAGCSGRSGGTHGGSDGTPTGSGTPAGPTPDGATPTPSGDVRFDADMFEPLRPGGYTVYFRHAATEDTSEELRESAPDDEFFADCPVQRNLSPTGRAQAHEIGYAADALSIPIAGLSRAATVTAGTPHGLRSAGCARPRT